MTESFTTANEKGACEFSVEQESGDVIIAAPLDRETAFEHELKIVATDGKYSVEKMFRIVVLDVNDNAPQCQQVYPSYSSKN